MDVRQRYDLRRFFCPFSEIYKIPLDLPPAGRCTIAAETEVRDVKINEVEALVGITRKNIRFYEAEGLLAPRRNSENGYRDYGEAEVSVLLQIKLLRKLGVPLEEIRRMQSGVHTVGDGMRRHLVTLERDRDNLEQAIRLCGGLTDRQERLEDLDAGNILKEMEAMEQGGATFQNKQKKDVRIRYVAPVAITAGMVLLMGGFVGLLLWIIALGVEDAPPVLMLLVLALVPLVIIGGVVLALVQRIREIGKGEIDDAAGPFLLLYLLLGGAAIFGIILGVIRALLQRLDEIDGGEEEEASRY